MITVLIATHNGARTLPVVLNAFCDLESPDGGWKLVVVDNGSTDRTKEIIQSFQPRLPLTYVFEPVLGKSVAQNAGLRDVSGDLAVFTDDDVLPRPDWLRQIRVAADSHSSFSIFGGSIVPHWEIPPDDWILRVRASLLAITDPSWKEGPIAPTRLFGPNMAVRSDVLKAGYKFDTLLGPIGSRYRMGEDTDFVQRLGNAGFRAWHCKRAVVAHIIRKNQMKKEWILGRAVPSGRADYRRELTDDPTTPVLFLGIPRYAIRDVFAQSVVFLRTRLTQNDDASFAERWQLHYLIGRAIEGRVSHKVQ